MPTPSRITFLAAALPTFLAAQSFVVAPAAYATTDAMSYEWIAGATDPARQQTLIGESHLLAMLGRDILAIELRRTAVDEAYLAGAMNFTVTLSISPNTPLRCSNVYAHNVGTNPAPVQVFSGTVNLPASPAVTGGVGSTVQWTANNTLRIAFTQPFHYAGGTLCIDITGQPIPGQKAWWMADAIEEVIPGSAIVELGPGCGPFGGPQRQWSRVSRRSLIPGGSAIFRAEGDTGDLAIAVFGAEARAPAFPQYPLLSQWGVPTPGCVSYVSPLGILAMVPATMTAESGGSYITAMAEVLVDLPPSSAWSGFELTTQWFNLNDLASSNGFRWTVGSAPSTLDMALCEGDSTLSTGRVTTYLAHVWRFEYL
ncbi:MAG: hypothetical protein KDC98_01520 [Planctomycetes bacterium]|nr:hypothetical protein [Planctomycetota bacterium]